MNPKLLALSALAFFILLSSFQIIKNIDLEGKWQAVSIEIPQEDSTIKARLKEQLEQIEALKTADKKMIKHFKTTNLKTIKKLAREEILEQPDKLKAQMEEAAAKVSLNLMFGGNAICNILSGSDSARWYLGDDGKKLFIDPFEQTNYEDSKNNQVMIFDIISVGKDNLRLRVHQQIGKNVFINLVRKQ